MKIRMRILLGISLLMLGLFLLSACDMAVPRLASIRGSGNVITEARDVHNFDRVLLQGVGEVTIRQGDEESLVVETDDNIMPHITTDVRGRTLILGHDAGVIRPVFPTRLRFTLNIKDLTGLAISGSGDIAMPKLMTDHLDLDISGSGNLNMNALLAKDVAVRISGSGDVTLRGGALTQNITISGSGKYQAGDLRSEAVNIHISGSGDATVWATDTFVGHISGSGVIRCYGDPQSNVSTSGSGEVIHLKLRQ